ncbi:MAG: hypothetical protein JWP25_8229 [Bradyrhizobium sp.]|nr:hypothetical protein [Bradyrhizobium sp.]
MALPGNHVLNTLHLTAYTPSCGGTPVAAYMRAPFRGAIQKFTGILGGAITTADGTVTVTNATQSTTIGTFTVTQSGSAAGQLFSGAPLTSAVAQVNPDDVLVFTPSGASGATIPMHFSLAVRSN